MASGESSNPWEPLAVQEPVTQEQPEDAWYEVRGDRLLCRHRLHLPRICMVSGVDVPADVASTRIRVYPAHRRPLAAGLCYPVVLIIPAWLWLPSGVLPILATVVCTCSALAGVALLLPVRRRGWGGVAVLGYLGRRVHRRIQLLSVFTGLVIPGCMSLLLGLTPGLGGAWPLSMPLLFLLALLLPLVVLLIFPLWSYLFPGINPSSRLRSDGLYELQGLSPLLLSRLQQSAERKA